MKEDPIFAAARKRAQTAISKATCRGMSNKETTCFEDFERKMRDDSVYAIYAPGETAEFEFADEVTFNTINIRFSTHRVWKCSFWAVIDGKEIEIHPLTVFDVPINKTHQIKVAATTTKILRIKPHPNFNTKISYLTLDYVV